MPIRNLEAKLRAKDPDYDLKKKIFSREIKKIFSKSIYLTPEVYRFVLDLNVQVPEHKLQALIKSGKVRSEEVYSVWTRIPKGNKVTQASFKTTKDFGKAIKNLLKNSPQFMFPPKDKIKFEGDQLIINNIPVPIKWDSARYFLCKYMFGSKITAPWELEDLVSAIGEDFDDNHDWYGLLYGKIKQLNKAIKEQTDYQDFILSQNGAFTINPLYQFLLSD